MSSITRRNFIASSSALALGSKLSAIEPPKRINPMIKGVSLAAYSLRSQMRWFKGKDGKGQMDMLQFLDYSAREQFDGVELTAYFFQEPVERSYLFKVKRRAHILGLDITGGAIGNNFSMHPSSAEAKKQSEYVKTWIDHYADLGAPVIRVFAGNRGPKGASQETIMKNIRINLAEALEHAEKRGVILGMENHDSMTDIDKLISFIKTIDSPYFGVTWDSANLKKTADPYADLAKLAPYTVNAQVKVKIPVNGVHVDTDLAKIVNILKEAEYAGYIVLEYEEKEDPLTEIPKFKKIIKDLI
ncbi:MAG: sugar phosphate isomerase/epimerase [Lentisphaeraceae bacterium]|nr:sugar phosphate isomerase/epimerase [Lentisphaeraceae bacterium]